MTIIDEITNEIITIEDYMDAMRETKSRIKFYNSEFDYENGQHHGSENAEYVDELNKIIIRRKQ